MWPMVIKCQGVCVCVRVRVRVHVHVRVCVCDARLIRG